MLTFDILTLFPEIFVAVLNSSILGRARKQNRVRINLLNLRNFATDSRKTVDDKPYGGGSGMVLKVDVVDRALESISPKPYSILLAATGKRFDQPKAIFLSGKKKVTLICGHYEGVDGRVENLVDETLSIGDFVLTGGEIAAMTIVDAVVRLLPGVIRKESIAEESFSQKLGVLEYPQFTRPEVYKGMKVPAILLSGNHKDIVRWRAEQALAQTKKYRPDLIKSKSE